MNILDNQLLGIIFGILLIIIFFFNKNKKIEAFGLWHGLMRTGFKLVKSPIELVMRLLGNMASKEVRNVTRDAKSMAKITLASVDKMANNAIKKTKNAVTDVTNKVQHTVKEIADNSMEKMQDTIQQLFEHVKTFIDKLIKQLQKFFTKTIVSTLGQGTDKAKEIWNYIVNSTYGKIKDFTARIKIYIMRFINYYIAKAKPYALYIAIGTGIISIGGIGSYIYFNFFHDPNAKSSNNNNTSVNNTLQTIPQTIPQTVQ